MAKNPTTQINPELFFQTLDLLAAGGLIGPLELTLSKWDWASIMTDEVTLRRRFDVRIDYTQGAICIEHPRLRYVKIRRGEK